MREIKFRAKSITGEWVYGNFIHSKRFQGCSNEFRVHDQETGLESDIIIETLGEFTGLKDKIGVDIYEGDIFHLGDKNIKYQVTFQNGYFGGTQVDNKSRVGLFFWSKNVEITGKIYENSELLR